MLIDNRAVLIEALRRLADSSDLDLSKLRQFATDITLAPALLRDLENPDAANPYGRNVIFESPMLECMVATWTPNLPCNPHDHGGSWGAVRVLRGRALHQIWNVQDGALIERKQHTASVGDVLACGPSLVHSMGDDAESSTLMTLHLYTKAIDHMIVYDVEANHTHIVDGSCGAWVPAPDSGLLRSSTPGILHRTALEVA